MERRYKQIGLGDDISLRATTQVMLVKLGTASLPIYGSYLSAFARKWLYLLEPVRTRSGLRTEPPERVPPVLVPGSQDRWNRAVVPVPRSAREAQERDRTEREHL